MSTEKKERLVEHADRLLLINSDGALESFNNRTCCSRNRSCKLRLSRTRWPFDQQRLAQPHCEIDSRDHFLPIRDPTDFSFAASFTVEENMGSSIQNEKL